MPEVIDNEPVKSTIKSWLDAGLAFFYPEVCQVCRVNRATPAEGFLCKACARQVEVITPPFCERCGLPVVGQVTTAFECSQCRDTPRHFTQARSAIVAKGVALEVIHRYKYQRALWFEPFLASQLVRQVQLFLVDQSWDLIVPVPLHSTKEREREFNQAERLARHLGKARGIPVNARLIRRVKYTQTQTHLDYRRRQENMRGAFTGCPGQQLNGERIILVDDVFTTGATTDACARTLLDMGAGSVMVWTLARGV